MKAKVVLFKPSGKYYTSEEWEIPTTHTYEPREGDSLRPMGPGDFMIPYCMRFSRDFRRIDNGKVLIVSQEPWGYPHLI